MHDLNRIQRDLQESLSLDKHPVALLIGAGCPLSVRIENNEGKNAPLIPDVRGLTDMVISKLAGNPAFDNVVKQFGEDDAVAPTIEDMLSRVRLLARVVGKGSARGLDKNSLLHLEAALCSEVAKIVRAELPSCETAYHRLVDWAGAIDRVTALQLFTTNYDLLIEQALEDRQIPFFDGFIGAREPFFDLRAIEDDPAPARWIRLWKMHGSINWKYSAEGRVTRCFPVPEDSDGVLIHPSELKYDQSRRMPYLAMIDRLRNFLRRPSAFLVTSGYSFADDHLNEVIIQGVRSNPTSAAYVLLYNSLEGEVAANKISQKIPPNISLVARDCGVVRGVRSDWMGDQDQGGSVAPKTSELGDFGKFTEFLRGLIPARRVNES
ncbi:SIR2 family protein [Lysobacter sp. 22409]|uniref:SIR2 family protein n=1 Tax=Lysobacter sp. 22409 TaxID=3453917 RepID=UPI003F82765E